MQSSFDIGLHNLYQRRCAESRSISPENPRGEKGKGAMANEATSLHPPSARWGRDLGIGWKASPCVDIASGQTITLMDNEGPGVIRHIWITQDFDFLRDAVLRVYWDGQAHPSIECPVGDFFCCSWKNPLDIPAVPFSVNPYGGMNCYFPMPFRKHVRVTVQNESPHLLKEFFYTINYTLENVPDDALSFHAHFRRTNPLSYATEYILAEGIEGDGQYVGTFMSWQQNNANWWGEGEIKMYLDGDDEFPTICGTGTEDYFGGAWGFGRDYTAPFAGYRMVSGSDGKPGTRMILYRFHVHDPIFFHQNLKVTLQALGFREKKNSTYDERRYLPLQDDIASVVYWYQDLPGPILAPLPSRDEREIN